VQLPHNSQVEIPSLGVVITSGDGSIEVENQT
ncbi:MAG: hypothetical protein UU25_C0007G0028, partial [Microgenomates group bacterium GW2011_GWB1_40_9]